MGAPALGLDGLLWACVRIGWRTCRVSCCNVRGMAAGLLHNTEVQCLRVFAARRARRALWPRAAQSRLSQQPCNAAARTALLQPSPGWSSYTCCSRNVGDGTVRYGSPAAARMKARLRGGRTWRARRRARLGSEVAAGQVRLMNQSGPTLGAAASPQRRQGASCCAAPRSAASGARQGGTCCLPAHLNALLPAPTAP